MFILYILIYLDRTLWAFNAAGPRTRGCAGALVSGAHMAMELDTPCRVASPSSTRKNSLKGNRYLYESRIRELYSPIPIYIHIYIYINVFFSLSLSLYIYVYRLGGGYEYTFLLCHSIHLVLAFILRQHSHHGRPFVQ